MATAVASAEPAPRRWRLRLPERLPNLKGKWLTAYTIVWAILLPLSMIGAARGTYISVTTPTMWSPYGFSTTEDSRGLHVDVVSSPAARAAGLRPDDYVVAVDGWQLPAVAARAAAREHVVKPDGSLTSFTLRRPNGALYEARLVRSIQNEEQAFRAAGLNRTLARRLSAAGALLVPVLLISAAILLFLRRRHEAVPALLSLSFLMFAPMVNGPDLIGVSLNILTIFGVGSACLLFAALLAFPSGRFQPRWTAIPFLLLPVWLYILFYPDAAGFASLLGVGFFILALAALVTRYRRLEIGAERQQLRWAFFGLSVFIVGQILGLLTQVATLAWQAEDPRWSEWGTIFGFLVALCFSAMIIGLMVSILRYRLYDADTVIGRSAAYAVLTVGFVALFAASEKVIELLGQEYFGQNVGALAGGVAAALAAFAIAPMHARTHRWAEKRFQAGLYRLRHSLPPLVGDLRETAGLQQIAGATLDSLIEGVRARRAAMIAADQLIDAREVQSDEVNDWWRNWSPPSREGIDCDRSDPLFPVRVPLEAEGHGRIGWLLLGPRPDGSLFGKSECDAIEEIAEPVARAVQVVLRRQEREESLEARFQAIEHAIAKLAGKAAPRTNPAMPTQPRIRN